MSNDFIDYYKLLGISSTSTTEEIKKAYYKKAKELHPDIHPELSEKEKEIMQEQLKVVIDAYKLLKDSDKKAQYDLEYKNHYAKQSSQSTSRQNNDYSRNTNTENSYQRTSSDYQQSRTNYSRENTRYKQHDYRRTNSKYTTNGFQSFVNDFNKYKKEIKREERRYPFTKRYNHQEDVIDEQFDLSDNEFLYYVEKFGLHIIAEGYYQMSKFKSFRKEPFTKFVIRNRKVLAGVLAGTIVIMSLGGNPKASDEETTIYEPEPYTTENTIEEPDMITQESSAVELTRIYKVENGDTLSQLAVDANVSQERIKSINDLKSDLLYYGDELTVPYVVDRDDLEYYQKAALVNEDMSLSEFTSLYETDLKTLQKLNPESITEINNQIVSMSDTLMVPNFITQKELSEQKSYTKSNQ